MFALVVLLLAQEPDLLGADEPPAPEPAPKPRQGDAPLVIPPPDGPVPLGVPVPDPPPMPMPFKRVPDETRARLIAERQRLLDALPGYAPPTVMTVIGGMVLMFGGTIAVSTAQSVIEGTADNAFLVSLPIALLGLGAFAFGLIWERERFYQREPLVERIDEIETELGW